MRNLQPKSRAGFTLVELLVVILIVAILASVALTAMFGAAEYGRQARTRAMIIKIDQLLAQSWESYGTRRVPIEMPPGAPPLDAAMIRLDALRELMRLELPDRKNDVLDAPINPGLERPAVSDEYRRRVDAVGAANWTDEHESAECLYMILSAIQDGDGSALEFFQEREMGDVDQDGMKELLDGWGRPIRFLRWAPGFDSTRQNRSEPDPLDPLRAYGVGSFPLYPLVMSAGPDGAWDVHFGEGKDLHFKYTYPPNDPFAVFSGVGQLGSTVDDNSDGQDNALDNIHNHQLDTAVR